MMEVGSEDPTTIASPVLRRHCRVLPQRSTVLSLADAEALGESLVFLRGASESKIRATVKQPLRIRRRFLPLLLRGVDSPPFRSRQASLTRSVAGQPCRCRLRVRRLVTEITRRGTPCPRAAESQTSLTPLRRQRASTAAGACRNGDRTGCGECQISAPVVTPDESGNFRSLPRD